MVSRAEIQAFADKIVRRFKPQRIVLFGSHANGAPTIDSDVDLMVIMPSQNELEQACEIRCAVDAGFPLDLLVRDPAVLRWRMEHEDWFLRDVMEKGIVLYEAADARVA